MQDPLQQLRDADLDDLLGQKAFHRFLADMLGDAGWMGSSFTGNALSTAFREGRRDLANQIISKCMARREDTLVLVLAEQASTLAPLIKGQALPDERDSPLYRDDEPAD